MTDLNINEIRELSRKANSSVIFYIDRYPYLPSYEKLNLALLKNAQEGHCSISFDFIDNSLDKIGDLTYKQVVYKLRRIYPYEGGNAINSTFNYPDYLISRGFNVEIRKSVKIHGYNSKSYYISW
jgi:hypothetical protein